MKMSLYFHLCPEMYAMAKMHGKNGEKSPASDNLSWIPNVAPWRLAILEKIARQLAIMAKNVPAPWRLAIWGKLAKILVISRMWQIFKLDAKSGLLKLYN